MTYQCQGENWGKSLIEDAIKTGYTIVVFSGDAEPDYKGTDLAQAWEAVTAVDDAMVCLRKSGSPEERAYLVLEHDQAGDEVINDHTSGGWIETWWNTKAAAVDATHTSQMGA